MVSFGLRTIVGSGGGIRAHLILPPNQRGGRRAGRHSDACSGPSYDTNDSGITPKLTWPAMPAMPGQDPRGCRRYPRFHREPHHLGLTPAARCCSAFNCWWVVDAG